MTAKPAVPPKPKALTEKKQLVAFSSRIPEAPVVISSPFDTSTQLEPKFFYGPATSSSSGFKSYYNDAKGAKKSSVAGKEQQCNGVVPQSSGVIQSSNISTSTSQKNSTKTSSRPKVKTKETFSSFYDPSVTPAKTLECEEVGLVCGSAFAEAKRKFGDQTSHASKDSPSYLSVHAADISSDDKQKIPTKELPCHLTQSNCQSKSVTEEKLEEFNPTNQATYQLQLLETSLQLLPLETSPQLLPLETSPQLLPPEPSDQLRPLETSHQLQPLETFSNEGEFFMGTTEDDIPPSRDSLVSSTDSEKSIGFKCDSEEHLGSTSKAHRVAAEIVETEFQYLQKLKLLLVDLPAAVQGSIPSEELSLMLQGLPQIEKLCEDLYEDLRIHLENYSSEKLISPVFLKKGKVLLLYVSYVNDFGKLIDTYRSLLRKYPNFADMVKQFELSPICKQIPLVEYFHSPIQRLPRYPLLLGTYLRALEEDHPDRENTKRALDLVSDVTAQANTTLASVEKVHKLLWYQARTVGYTFLQSNRTFIREGILRKLSRKAPQDRTVLLCSDVLICGEFDSITGTKFTVNQEYFLHEIKVEHSIDSDYFDRALEFGIYSVKKSVVFQAHSIEERNAWLTAISRATEDVQKNASRRKIALNSKTTELLVFAPIWVPDYRVTACQLCKKQFSLFRRYHHCRLCGYAVCASCSPREVGIDYKDNRSKRVCIACFNDTKKQLKFTSAKSTS